MKIIKIEKNWGVIIDLALCKVADADPIWLSPSLKLRPHKLYYFNQIILSNELEVSYNLNFVVIKFSMIRIKIYSIDK